MARADTRGDDRAKPEWGRPPRGGAAAKPGERGGGGKVSATAERPLTKAEAARLAREQAKAARAEAKAARAQARRQGKVGSAARRAEGGPPRAGTGAAGAARRAAPKQGPTGNATSSGASARRSSTGTAAAGRARRSAPATAARPAARGAAKRAAPARRSRSSAFRKRYAVVHDIEGPRVRLGICWFLLALFGIFGGALTTAVVYGGAAAIAAAQTARIWRKQKARPNEAMAAGAVGIVAAGACIGAGGAGLGLLGAVALAFVGAAGDVRSRNPRLADVGWTLQAALPPAVVAMSVVLLTRLDQGSAVALLLLVSAFETGDFLIGSGSRNPYEGPAAGAAAIVVVTFIISALPISTLSFGEAWLLGGAVALLAPAGQLVASALLPSATAPASALRRLDSLLLAAPLWAWAVGLFE